MDRRRRRKPVWPWLVMLGVILAGGYWYYARAQATTEEAEEPALQTTTVRKGDIVITAVGNGNLEPAAEVDLAFRAGGLLAELLVSPGDHVTAGQVLARLDDTDAQRQVSQAQIALELAELKSSELQRKPTEQELEAAERNLRAAELTFYDLASGPSETGLTIAGADLEKSFAALQKAQAAYDKVSWKPEISSLPQSLALEQATLDYQKAQAVYEQQTAGADADDIVAAQAKIASAQVQLDTLVNGPAAEELRTAELQVELARLALQQAMAQLAATELAAVQDGTVVQINSAVGESVGTGPVLTLADLDGALMHFYLEESDLNKVTVGNKARVTFDAYPELIFEGLVTRVDPLLMKVDNVPAVSAWVSLTLPPNAPLLLAGLSGEAEIIAGEAYKTPLVPVQALRELAPGQYAVFLVAENGDLKLTPVEVGLKDFANAQIISGLNVGDVVSTGTVETE